MQHVFPPRIYSMPNFDNLPFPRSMLEAECQTADPILALHDAWLKQPFICRATLNKDKNKTFNVFLNRHTHVAVLGSGCSYSSVKQFTTKYLKQLDHTHEKRSIYYKTVKSIAAEIRAFFSSKYSDYHLIVDVSSTRHQSALYLWRDRDTGDFTVYAFDPNNGHTESNLITLSKEVSRKIRFINMWSSRRNNDTEPGICFQLTWRFIHLVFSGQYNPVVNERVLSRYNVKSMRSIELIGPAPPGQATKGPPKERKGLCCMKSGFAVQVSVHTHTLYVFSEYICIYIFCGLFFFALQPLPKTEQRLTMTEVVNRMAI